MKENQDSYKVFEGQRDGEEFLLLFREHIISMRKGFYLFLVVFAISCVPTFVFLTMEMLWIALGGFLLGLMLFLYNFMKWYFSIFILTDQRLRQIVRKGFFSKEVLDLPLSKIQSVNYNVSGFFAEIFKFGTINIFTIVGDLTIKNVEHPDEIYNKIQDVLGEISEEEYAD